MHPRPLVRRRHLFGAVQPAHPGLVSRSRGPRSRSQEQKVPGRAGKSGRGHTRPGPGGPQAAAGAALFVAALAAHEIAHAIVARHWGVQVRSITLWALGGTTALDGNPPTARANFQIVAGPATSLTAGLLRGGAAALARFAHAPAVLAAALAWLSLMNVVLAVFKLLPRAPLWTAGGSCARWSGSATATGSARARRLPEPGSWSASASPCSACWSCSAGGTSAACGWC